MKRLLLSLASLGILAIGAFLVFLPAATAPTASYGATNTQNLIGGFPYFLAGSGVSSSASSITLTSLTLPQSGYEIKTSDLSSPFYITFEAGNTTKQEFASCTTVTQSPSNTTAVLSGCIRGLLPVTPYSASTTYAFSHTGGTTVIFSNPPQVYNGFYALGNVSTSTNILIFSSTTPPRFDQPGAQAGGSYIATTSELASVAYVNAVAIAGASNADETTKGVVELATGLEAASSTSLGGTAARLVLPSNIATDTPNTSTRGSKVLLSQIGGYLNQGWLDLSAIWPFTGGILSTASSTYTATTSISASNVNSRAAIFNGLAYAFPSSRGAANTTLTENGSGTLAWSAPVVARYNYATTTAIVANNNNATSTSMGIPAGTLVASSTITFYAKVTSAQGTNSSGKLLIRDISGTTLASMDIPDTTASGGFSGAVTGTIYANNSISAQIYWTSIKGILGSAASTNDQNGTASFNTANALTLVGVISSPAAVDFTLSDLFITVNP